jgi:hypothetical protein
MSYMRKTAHKVQIVLLCVLILCSFVCDNTVSEKLLVSNFRVDPEDGAYSSETLVFIYKTTRCYNPQDHKLNSTL